MYYNSEMGKDMKKNNIKLDTVYNVSNLAYIQSKKALTAYILNHEINPSEKKWNKLAIQNNFLSSKTLGYIEGIGFNKLCKKIRKELKKHN